MRFAVYQVSRRGGREKNEDRMGYCYTRESGLFAVADGMGGHPEGEVAAQMALQVLSTQFQRLASPRLADPLQFLNDAVISAHQQLLRYGAERKLGDTPRTTLVACVLQGGTAHWAHCGDSRLYFVRGDRLVARTRDHSYSELRDAMPGLGGGDKVNRNVLFTCLGSPGRPVVDAAGPLKLQRGDRVLMCSDGLWSPLSDEQIVAGIAAAPISESAPELADKALKAAGARSDNVTLLTVEWEADEDDAPSSMAVSTTALGDDHFASTIQATVADDGEEEVQLDEAEIERSIREINEAIARASQRRQES